MRVRHEGKSDDSDDDSLFALSVTCIYKYIGLSIYYIYYVYLIIDKNFFT